VNGVAGRQGRGARPGGLAGRQVDQGGIELEVLGGATDLRGRQGQRLPGVSGLQRGQRIELGQQAPADGGEDTAAVQRA
jgi:hypothetical protein